jgi:tetratricopeptide (TPR) repeat protein
MSFSRLAASLFTSVLLTIPAICQGTTPAIDAQKVRAEANAAVQSGDFATAAAGFRKLTEARPKDAQAWHMLGYSLHAGGKLDEALAVHRKAAEFPATARPATYNVACVHALQGRSDEAFVWLEKAIALGFADGNLLANDADLASLRDDARFAKLQQSMQANGRAAGAQAFAQTTPRRNTRVVWFDRQGSPGQIAIDWTPVAWNDRYDASLAEGTFIGKRWRLGADFWTTLDTSVPLQFGAVRVPPGYYYLTLLQPTADTFVLAVHDATAVRQQKLDAAFAHLLKAGIEVPLQHAVGDETAAALAMGLTTDPGANDAGTLTVQFGAHLLTAAMKMQLD